MEVSRKKLRYSVLKEIESGRGKYLSPDKLGISSINFRVFVEELEKDDYIRGTLITKDKVGTEYSSITEKGEKFISENNAWSKTYGLLKEIRDWVKP